jgi:hypothetical protein
MSSDVQTERTYWSKSVPARFGWSCLAGCVVGPSLYAMFACAYIQYWINYRGIAYGASFFELPGCEEMQMSLLRLLLLVDGLKSVAVGILACLIFVTVSAAANRLSSKFNLDKGERIMTWIGAEICTVFFLLSALHGAFESIDFRVRSILGVTTTDVQQAQKAWTKRSLRE